MANAEQQLPDGWELTTLGKLANYINGRAFKPKDWGMVGRPIIRIQNLTGSTGTVNRFAGAVEPKYIIRDGDLLISWSATLGAFIYRGEEAVLNQHIFKVEPFVNKKFLFYLVKAYLDSLKRQVHGSGMQHITKGKFDNSPVPLPPPDEQKRIADKLDALLARVEQCQTHLERVPALLKAFRQSVLAAATSGRLTATEFDSETADYLPLAEIIERVKTGPFGSALHKSDYISGGIPLVNPMHINNGRITPSNEMTISEEMAKQLQEFRLTDGDVIIARRGVMGRCAVVSSKEEGWLCGSGSMILRPTENILPDYLQIFLSSRLSERRGNLVN